LGFNQISFHYKKQKFCVLCARAALSTGGSWRAACLEMEFPSNNYRSESSDDWYWIAFNYSFVWLLVTANGAAVCRADCNNAQALFCPVSSYLSKSIALSAISQGAPAYPSYKSYFFYENVSTALVE